MTVLQALAGYYGRMADRGEVSAEGFSTQPIDYKLVIAADGAIVDAVDLRHREGKRVVRQLLSVPHPQRTSNVMPNFLWDKTAYLFGITAGADHRTAQEHAAFKEAHLGRLRDVTDPSLVAFRNFVARWEPSRFDSSPFKEEMKDKVFVVALDGTTHYAHDTEEAGLLVSSKEADLLPDQLCLVSGKVGPITRLHPVVKNVWGGQSSGGYLVSFNAPAFVSWGQVDGANAPTTASAAAQYGLALNRLLVSSLNRMQIGDTTVAFWADTSDVREDKATATERMMAEMFGDAPVGAVPTDNDAGETRKVRDALAKIADGRPAALYGVDVEPGTRVHILGLSPNAARLSVRFWLTERLEVLARNLTLHAEHCCVEPPPWTKPPSINRLLVNTVAAQEKWDNIPPLLAGEVARAVLGGAAYPRTLLSNALMRLRAGDDPASGWHAAVIRAGLARDQYLRREDRNVPEQGETPVSLDPNHRNIGYQLGRLFALLEIAQREALGRGVNSTIRDKYFGAASATPASIFPLIISNGQNHLSKIRKERPGWAFVIEREFEEIYDRITPREPLTLPRSLKLEQQGEFAIGYYHQRKAKLGGNAGTDTSKDTEQSQ